MGYKQISKAGINSDTNIIINMIQIISRSKATT